MREIARSATEALDEQFRLLRLIDQRTKLGKKGSKKHRALSEEIRKLRDQVDTLRRRHYLILKIESDRQQQSGSQHKPVSAQGSNHRSAKQQSPEADDSDIEVVSQREGQVVRAPHLLDTVDPQQEQLLVSLHGGNPALPTRVGANGNANGVRKSPESIPLFNLDSQEGAAWSNKTGSPAGALDPLFELHSIPEVTPKSRKIASVANEDSDSEQEQGENTFRPTENPENQGQNMTDFAPYCFPDRMVGKRPEMPIGSLPDHLYPKQFSLSDKKRPFPIFLRDYEAMTRAHDWQPETACRWLPVFLGGDSRVRYNTLPDWVKTSGDYKTLIKHLTDLFNPPTEAGFALQRFHTVAREKDETLETYGDKLNTLLSQAEPNL